MVVQQQKHVNALPILCKCLSLLKSNKSVILLGIGWALVYQHMLVCWASYLRISKAIEMKFNL